MGGIKNVGARTASQTWHAFTVFRREWKFIEDARNLVETATLAGAVIGSGKTVQSKESRNEENISD
jgi:hypothetical protein